MVVGIIKQVFYLLTITYFAYALIDGAGRMPSLF